MADTVDSKVLFNGTRLYAIRLINVSDGTGESTVTKITRSSLTGPKGVAPSSLKLREASWSIQGFTSVRIFWDATTDDEIATFAAGNGYANWTGVGGQVDPQSSGANGNIILTTAGATSGATYDITLVFELKG